MAKVIVSVPSQSNTVIVSPILATPVVTSIPVDNLSDLNLTKSVVQPNQIMVYNGTSWIYDYGHDQKFYAEAYNELVSGVELYYTATADGDGYITQDLTATPAEGNEEQRRLYYKSTAFGDSGTTAGYTDAGLATDATYAEMLVAFNNLLKTEGAPITVYATRAEAPAFTGLLNETYGSGAAAAYSLRRLNGNYTGAAIEVERSSDNTTQDIGFDDNGDLDESALTTFCAGTTCKVRTWYDQSQSGGTGSGNDAVQTTHANQPTIYTGGALNEAPYFDTSNVLALATGVNITSSFLVARVPTINQGSHTAASGSNPRWWWGGTSLSGIGYKGDGGALQSGVEDTVRRLQSVFVGDATDRQLIDGTQKNTDNDQGVQVLTHLGGRDNNTENLRGYIYEFIGYNVDKYSVREDIHQNIGDGITQNTPLLDTYTGAAAAYSLRKLRTAYTGSAIRVRRSNDNAETDIGFNVFGELDTVSLAAHCGSNDGFVKTWYDQSGNANDASQSTTTNQPKIYDSGTGVMTENGKPAFEFDGSNDVLLSGLGWTTTNKTIHIVAKPTATNNYFFGILNDSGGSRARFYLFDQSGTNQGRFIIGNPAVSNQIATTQTQQLYYMDYASSNHAFDFAVNGNAVNSATGNAINPSGVGYMIGGINNGNDTAFDNGAGLFQEVIIYDSDQSSNRTGIESNINTFYSIYS